jgi:DNA polymerase-3 subunit delta'
VWRTAGQDRIINFLRDSIARRSLAHAYLLVGPPHIGKMTLALDLAGALNCCDSTPPCGSCRACQRIQQGKYPDVIVIDKYAGRDQKDRRKATEIGIDTVRELLQRGSNLPPYEGKYKVFIIDDADLMSVEAANCLLKTLEEPPQHVIILLLTSQESALLPTVLSRCQRFELKPVAVAEIESRLKIINDSNPDKIKIVSRLSGGCLGWAIAAIADNSYLQSRDARLGEFASLLTRSWSDRLSYIQQLPSDRNSVEEMIKLWLFWCRDVMLLKYNCEDAATNVDKINDIKSWANVLTILEIKEFIDSLNMMMLNLSYNANMHLLLEVIMLDMPKKEKRADYAISSAGVNN